MKNNDWINETTVIQVLLDAEAQISNADKAGNLAETRKMLHRQIEVLRGPAPPCYGQDDCSTLILSTCPWRMKCGD